MNITKRALASFVILAGTAAAFQPLSTNRRVALGLKGQNQLHEFDFLMGENPELGNTQQAVRSRRRIHLNDDRATVLASTTFASPETEAAALQELANAEADPYAEIGLEEATPQLEKLQEEQGISQKIESKLKTMDLQDIVATLIIPSIVVFAGGRWVYNRAAGRISGSLEETLDSFAREMIYHDGDFEEMKLCHSDYSKKLVMLGPSKTSTMLKRYLALYAKKRTVSPQAIRYVDAPKTF